MTNLETELTPIIKSVEKKAKGSLFLTPLRQRIIEIRLSNGLPAFKSPNPREFEIMASEHWIANLQKLAGTSNLWLLVHGEDEPWDFIDDEPVTGERQMLSKELDGIRVLAERRGEQIQEASYHLRHRKVNIFFDLRPDDYAIELEFGPTTGGVKGYNHSAPYKEMLQDDFRIMFPIIREFVANANKING